jgi:predicted nicotinamide N-methyase
MKNGSTMTDITTLREQYDVDVNDMTIAGKKFQFATPKTIDAFIDPEDITRDFPLWAKIWKASWVLAEYVAKQPSNVNRRILELGSGVGVVGVVASTFGHRITMTEYNEHALNFASANAALNRCRGWEIHRLDWHRPDIGPAYDWIIGSEILYHERDFVPLLNIFRTCLKPEGRITLTMGVRKDGMMMMEKISRFFTLTATKYTLRSEDESTQVLLCHLSPKS